jgi:hypothetical protein
MNPFSVLALLRLAAALPQGTLPAQNTSTPKSGPTPASGALNSLISALPAFLGAADLKNNVANDLVEGVVCKDIIYVIARGSGEPGNIGMLYRLSLD